MYQMVYFESNTLTKSGTLHHNAAILISHFSLILYFNIYKILTFVYSGMLAGLTRLLQVLRILFF